MKIMATLRLKRVDGLEKYKVDRRITLGRHHDNDIVIRSEEVSRHHCLIDIDEDGNVFVKDLGSANGTFVNDRQIEKVQVFANDVLQIGSGKYVFLAAEAKKEEPVPVSKFKSILLNPYFQEKIGGISIRSIEDSSKQCFWPVNSISTIGRLKFSDLCLDDPSVSRSHARIEVREHRVVISDTNSTNGTYVNDKRIIQKELQDGDTIGIGSKFNFTVTFNLNKEDSFTSLKKHVNFRTVNVLEELNKMLELFQKEFGDQVLSEVERQTLLFCEEFEHILATHDIKTSQRKDIHKLLKLLSKSEHVIDSESLKALIGENKSLDTLTIDFLQDVEHMTKLFEHQKFVYLEETYPEHPTVIHMNGVIVNFNSDFQALLFGIPYENMLYLMYASNWLAQLQVTL